MILNYWNFNFWRTEYENFQIRKTYYRIRDLKPHIDSIHYFNYINHEKVRFMMNIPKYNSLADVRKDLDLWKSFTEEEGKIFGVSIMPSDELIGTFGFTIYEDKNIAEILSDLNYKYFGLGIMARCCKFLIDYAKGKKIDSLVATVLKTNKVCLNLLINRFKFDIIDEVEQNNRECYLLYLSI